MADPATVTFDPTKPYSPAFDPSHPYAKASTAPAAPTATISARQSGITHPINWLQDLEGDIRYGSNDTWAGKALHAIGLPAQGDSPTTNAIAGPVVGPPRALRGALRIAHGVGKDLAAPFDPSRPVNPEITKGTNEAIGGGVQTLAPLAVTNPAFLPTAVGYSTLQKGVEKGARALGANPDESELAGNLASLGVGAMHGAGAAEPEALERVKTDVQTGLQKTGKAVVDTARQAYGIANPDALTAEQSATKAVKPRNSKTNWSQEVQSALPDVRRSVDNLGIDIDNANFDDVERATLQAKKDVWGEYQNKFSKPNQDVAVDTSPVADEIRKTISQRTREQNPQLSDRIEGVAKTYDGRNLSVADLEDRIGELNNETRGIEARYPADKAAAKSLPENAPVFAERNALRNLLISKLDELEGPGAQDLRTRYGALNSFQDALQRRKAVYERQNPEGLAEQVGRFEGVGQIARGAAKIATLTDPLGGVADVAGGVATRTAAKAGRQINDSQFLLRQALRKTAPRPAVVARVTPEYIPPAAPAQVRSGIAGLLPRGVYEQPAGTPPPEPKLLEHMAPIEGEYVPEPAQPARRPIGFLPRGVYQQPGGFEPNQPALPEYRGIPLGPSTMDAANAQRSDVRVPVEPNGAQGPALPTPGAGQPELVRGGVSGRTPGGNQPQRAAQGTPGGTYGARTQVLTSGSNLPGQYKVVEASDLTPSHNAASFAPNPDYPAGVQERTYHTSKEAQARVIQQSQNYDPNYTINTNPDAVNGPPIVTKDGIVLGGNSRTMSTQRLYAAGKGEAYKNELARQAANFGLDPNAIAQMKQPVLVREVTPTGGAEGMRKLAADLNKSMTGALSVEEKAVSAGKSVSPATLDAIGDLRHQLGDDATLRDVLRSAGRHILNMMIHDGAITERERPQLVDTATGGLSEEGKNFVERALLGSVVDDPTLMQHTPKAVLDRVGGSLGDITKLGAREDEYNILPLLREALRDHAEMASSGLDLDTFLGQQGMFGRPRSAAVEALVRTLAQRPQQVRAAFRQFGQDASFNQPGQGTLALTETPSAAKSFNEAFGANVTDDQLLDALRDSMLNERPVEGAAAAAVYKGNPSHKKSGGVAVKP